MLILNRSLNWIFMRPKVLFESAQVVLCNGIHHRQRSRSQDKGNHRSRLNSEEHPRWWQKMHQSLIKYESLPLPRQDVWELDASQLQLCHLEELIPMVWDIKKMDHKANFLLMELWRRMDDMSVDQILSVADILFIKNIHSKWYLGSVVAYFSEIMEIVEFTPFQLVHLSFHTLDHKLMLPPSFVLALENRITHSVELLSLNELAVICHSFFTSQLYIRSLDLLEKISIKLIKEFDSLNNYYLPVLMKTLRYSNFIKISFYKDLGDLLMEKRYLDRFRTLAQIMHIAHAYASVRVSHPVLFSHILNSSCHPKFNFRLKDLAKLIWSCGTLVTDSPEDIAAIRRILTYLEYNLSLRKTFIYPDNLVDIVNGLSFLNIYPDFLLNMLFHRKNVTTIIEKSKNNESKLPQLNIIDSSLDIEYPSYTGNRLSKKSKSVVASLLGNFPLEKEMSYKKGLKEALAALQQMFGEDKVLCTKILPHFDTSDIVLVWNTTESKFIGHDENGHRAKQTDGCHVRLAVQILGNPQTSYDGKPLGMLHMKLRQLTKLGYQAVLIDAEDAAKFIYCDVETTQTHLLKTISHAVNTDNNVLLSS